MHRINLQNQSWVTDSRLTNVAAPFMLTFKKLAVPSQLTCENGTLRLSVIALPPAAVVGSDGVSVMVAYGNPDWLSTALTRLWAMAAVFPGKAATRQPSARRR